MAISFFAYVATFSGQLHFWRNYFSTLLQSNNFDTTVTFSELLLFWGASFFRTVTSPLQSFFQNSYCFWAKLLPSSHFLRIGSSLGQVLFGTPNFLVEKLFRIRNFSEDALFWTRYFCAASTFSEELVFAKS